MEMEFVSSCCVLERWSKVYCVDRFVISVIGPGLGLDCSIGSCIVDSFVKKKKK